MSAKKLTALLDGSVYSNSVCEHAAWAADRAGLSIELLHVLGRREVTTNLSGNIGLGARTVLLEELAELDGQTAKLSQKRGRAILEGAKELIESSSKATVENKLINGDLIEVLSHDENQPDLIVIGKRGVAADFAQLHLGSNLERVVRSAKMPVLVASRVFEPIKKLLIAFDGGKSANKAVSHLASSGLVKGLEVVLLTVGEETSQIKRDLEGSASLLKDGGCSVSVQVQNGQVDAVISSEVEKQNVDLVVMGAYGHSRIRSLIIGSTTTEMLRSCKVPVLLFRTNKCPTRLWSTEKVLASIKN